MRAILLASAAVIFAAAPVSSASAQNPRLNMDWSGIYVGGNIGGTWGRTNVQIPAYPANFNISSSSFSGGGQIGANWQTSDWLLRSEEHTSELQSHVNLVCRLLLEKKKAAYWPALMDD